jgi:transposase-like protein
MHHALFLMSSFIELIAFHSRYGYEVTFLIGVDQFFHSCLLGVGIIDNENGRDYQFVLSELKKSLTVSPSAVLTDEHSSFPSAVSSVFPHSEHLLCVWHFIQNLQKRVNMLGMVFAL